MASLPTGSFSNAEAIYKGLLGLGLSTDAAAGVAGNIYQETHGDWHDVGGLIEQEGLGAPKTFAAALKDIASYIKANGSVGAINKAATSPAAAAMYFSSQYERPGAPDNANRVAAAEWVAAAAKSGHWGTSAGTTNTGASTSGNIVNQGGTLVASEDKDPKSESGSIWGELFSGISNIGGAITDPVQATLGIAEGIGGFAKDVTHFLKMVDWFFEPSSWVRMLSGAVGIILLLVAAGFLFKAAGGSLSGPTGGGGGGAPMIIPIPA